MKISILLPGLLLAWNALAISDPFDDLNPRFSGSSEALRATTWGDGIYVAVGEGGTVLSSVDSVTWVPRESGTSVRLTGVAFGTNGFVAVGEGSAGLPSTILSSVDGMAWTRRSCPVTNNLSSVCFDMGHYVAVGSRGMILVSTNGVHWTVRSTGAPFDLNAVAAGFVAVGESGTILTSPDGLAWTARFSGIFADLKAVSATSSGYVAAGNAGTIATSDDGVTWTVRTSGVTTNLRGVTFNIGGGLAVIGEGGVFLTSQNGTQWTPKISGTSKDLHGICFAQAAFLAVGDSGSIQAGIPWVPAHSGTSVKLRGIAYGNGTYVAVGGDDPGLSDTRGIILFSTNRTDWYQSYFQNAGRINDAVFDGNRFVAVGAGKILSSTNGRNWETQGFGSTNLGIIVHGNGIYVAHGGYGQIGPGSLIPIPVTYWSLDSATWILSDEPRYAFESITFGKNLFVAVSSRGIWTSRDGKTWAVQRSSADELHAVTFANGSFTAVGYSPVFISQDGTNWTGISSTSGLIVRGITSGDQGLVGIGISSWFFGSGFTTSADSTNWTVRGLTTIDDGPKLVDIIFADGGYLAVGEQGTIVQSMRPTARAFLANAKVGANGFEMNIIAQPGFSYRVQKKSNLSPSDWAALYNFTSTNAVTPFVDSEATNAAAGLYRVVSP